MARPRPQRTVTGRRLVACGLVAVIALAACSRQMEPAERAIADIHATVAASARDAAKYLPEQLARVQMSLAGLELSFNRHDYSAVLAAAPSVMHDARSLAAATAARKREVVHGLDEEWTALAASLPDTIGVLRGRIDSLDRRPRSAPGIDLPAVRRQLLLDESLWSKAQAAFATGNLDEAVSTSRTLKGALSDLAAELP